MNWTSFLSPSSATGPNGDSASINYDTNARPSTTTSPTGATTTFTYGDTSSPPYKLATTNGHWVKTTFDGYGRTIKTETGNGGNHGLGHGLHLRPLRLLPARQAHPNLARPLARRHRLLDRQHLRRQRPHHARHSPRRQPHRLFLPRQHRHRHRPGRQMEKVLHGRDGQSHTVQEPDPTLGNVSTNYTYDILNHLIQVSMPRGANTQTRTFDYLTPSTSQPGAFLRHATNPENGTVTYTYNSDSTLATKTDAKGQVFSYTYDSYKRVTQISVGATVLRTFIYDSNSLDGSFSTYSAGRLVAVVHPAFSTGVSPGPNMPAAIQFTEMYSYTQAGQVNTKRLQINQTLPTPWGSQTRNLDAAYSYDNEGKMTSVNYPTTYSISGFFPVATAGPTYTYSFDAMSRPTTLTDQTSFAAVNSVQYNAANQVTSMNYFYNSETRQYNSLGQMTNLNSIVYNYPTGTNNGKIASQTISGETVTYQYDSLNRLLSAAGTGWAETYGYDGFGNLVAKTPTAGSPPTLSIAVNPATNQIVGRSYDANGNDLTTGSGYPLTYDAENRIQSAPGVQYALRLPKQADLERDDRQQRQPDRARSLLLRRGRPKTRHVFASPELWPGPSDLLRRPADEPGRLLRPQACRDDRPIRNPDPIQRRPPRLPNRASHNPQPTTPGAKTKARPGPNDEVKFATYTRDSATGLDYADQRYYSSQFGRFTSPDPYQASGGPSSPKSWNRYSYTRGDPVNRLDPTGLDDCISVFGADFCIEVSVPILLPSPDCSL